VADFETIKITELKSASAVNKCASVVITQPCGGKERVFRAPLSLFLEMLKTRAPVVKYLPVATEDMRGQIVLYDDGAGDLLYVCVGNTDGTYEWLPLGEDGSGLPSVKPADDGKILVVENGEWAVKDVLADKQDVLTFDPEPTEGSTNPVTSGGVYEAIENASGLPEVTTDDDGKIVLVEDGSWVKSNALTELRDTVEDISSLPEVTTDDAGKTVIVNDNGEWEASVDLSELIGRVEVLEQKTPWDVAEEPTNEIGSAEVGTAIIG